MKSYLSGALLALLVSLPLVAIAQDDTPLNDNQQSNTQQSNAANNNSNGSSDNAAELDAIRATVASFEKAFNAGNAQAVAAHWAQDGELIDESGYRFAGREEIAAAYKAFFAENKGVTLTTSVNQLRMINAESAIEDGESTLHPAPAGAPATARYTAVHVKRDGKWLMYSVRESRLESSGNYDDLADLENMIGTWTSESNGVMFEATSQWMANKNFIEQTFSSTQNGQTVSSGKQIIGWDPQTQNVVSWTFTSDGGHAFGVWTPHETGWTIETTGTMADGTQTTAVNIMSKIDDNALAWRSVNRTAGAFSVLDTDEVVLRRKTQSGQ